MNIALAMLGRCGVWTAERVPAAPPVKRAEVPWEILRSWFPKFLGLCCLCLTKLNLLVFECNGVNNATDAFCGDWEAAAKLTKTEVLTGRVQEAQIYYTEKWYERTRKMILCTGREVA